VKWQQTLAGAMALSVLVAMSGCSGGNSLSPSQLFQSASAKGAGRAAEDPATRSELALARLSERRGQLDYAERLYLRLIEKNADNPVPYHRLGVMRAQQGRFEEANQDFAEAIRLAPSDATLLSDAGYCYYLQHRLDEAEAILRRAHDLRPNDPAVSNNLGVLLGEQGRDHEALAMFRITGTEAQACANMAFVHAQRGEIDQAKASYSRALTMDQNLKPAAEALVQIARHERSFEPSPSAEPGRGADSGLALQTPSAPPRQVEAARSLHQPAGVLTDPAVADVSRGSCEVAVQAPPAPQRDVEAAWSLRQPAGVLAEPSGDDATMGSVEITDSAQPASFEQYRPGSISRTSHAAPSFGTARPHVDFASGLNRLLSEPD